MPKLGPFPRRLKIAVGLLAGAGALALVLSYAVILDAASRTRWTGKPPAVSNATIVVLGMGPTPAMTFHDRTELAADLWASGIAAAVVTTGAQGDDEYEPESTTMANDLLARGIPAAAITEESQSRSTFQNLTFAQRLLAGVNRQKLPVVIVTHDYHAARAEVMAAALGLDAVVVTSAGPRLDRRAHREAREVLAYLKWVFLGF